MRSPQPEPASQESGRYLQFAGYDVARLPITTICRGLSIDWPLDLARVPN
jgi:hypothetical protein